MPEPVLYIRGLPTSLIDRLISSEDVLQDLKAVAGLSDEQIGAIGKRLAEAKGFLDPRVFSALLRDIVSDDKTARSVQRAMRNLGPDDVEPLLKALSERQDGEPNLQPAEISRLRQVLHALIHRYPALTRYEKAERLATATGQRMEAVELICDLRPIFDDSRKRLEGMMPYTRFRLVTGGADGLPDAFEVELTRQQVQDLADQAAKAVQKLDLLVEAIETQWMPGGLPDLPLTRGPRKEQANA